MKNYGFRIQCSKIVISKLMKATPVINTVVLYNSRHNFKYKKRKHPLILHIILKNSKINTAQGHKNEQD